MATDDENMIINLDSSLLHSLHINGQCLTIPTIDHDGLCKKLKYLNINKGPDGIPPIFVSACASALTTPLYYIYNKSLESGQFPREWKKAKIVPIHK